MKKLVFGVIIDILLVVLALIIAIVLHECAHCATAYYFGLESKFQITDKAVGPIVDFSDDEFVNRIVNVAGLIVNISLAVIAVFILFLIQGFMPAKDSILFTYNKNLHSLIEEKYHFLIGGHMNAKLFLLIFALANILLTLFILLLYPFTGSL